MSEVIEADDYTLTYNDKGWGVSWCLQHEVTKNILAAGRSRTINDMVDDVTMVLRPT